MDTREVLERLAYPDRVPGPAKKWDGYKAVPDVGVGEVIEIAMRWRTGGSLSPAARRRWAEVQARRKLDGLPGRYRVVNQDFNDDLLTRSTVYILRAVRVA